jgi:transposase
MERARVHRDRLIAEATALGMSRRQVAEAVGLSRAGVQHVINRGRAGD